MDLEVDNGACQGGQNRQSESPAGRHHQDPEHKHRTEGVARGNMPEQLYQDRFPGDQPRGDHDAKPQRRGNRAQQQ